jgi:hypothetical protein
MYNCNCIVQAGKWQFARWNVDGFEEFYDPKLTSKVDLPNTVYLYPVLVVVESKCAKKIREAAEELLDYAKGAKHHRVENVPESTSDSDNQMNRQLYEERMARMTQGASTGTQQRSQTASLVPTKVSPI